MTALVTPFENGEISADRLKMQVNRQIEAGIKVLVPCGTTGESPTLSHEEHEQVIDMVIDAADGRVPVLAGAGSNCTKEAIRLTRHAKQAGAAGALTITPYYNKPSQRGLIAHFTAIADAVDLPLVLYNVPGRTGVNMTAETVAHLAGHSNIVGVKEASGDIVQMAEILALCPPDFNVISGDDSMTYPLMMMGGKGVISVVSNIIPAQMSAMCDALADNKSADAREIFMRYLPLMQVVFIETNPVPVKEAMKWMGLDSGQLRLPQVPLTDEHRDELLRVMSLVGLEPAS